MIVVTGATGTIGRPLVDTLAAVGEEVVAVSRSAQPGHHAPGVRWAQADVGNAASLKPAVTGARAVFILVAGVLINHGESPYALLDVVASAAPERIVLISSQLVGTRPAARSHARLGEYEAAVRASGRNFTVLRSGHFASNALAWAETVRARRTVYAPFGDVAMPAIDPIDVSAVAAAVLTEDGHAGRTYELTGPEPITPRQQAAVISEALGEEVAFVEVSREQAHAGMTQYLAEEMAAGALDVLGAPLPSEQATRPDVQAVLHRPASSFDAWVARHLPAFR